MTAPWCSFFGDLHIFSRDLLNDVYSHDLFWGVQFFSISSWGRVWTLKLPVKHENIYKYLRFWLPKFDFPSQTKLPRTSQLPKSRIVVQPHAVFWVAVKGLSGASRQSIRHLVFSGESMKPQWPQKRFFIFSASKKARARGVTNRVTDNKKHLGSKENDREMMICHESYNIT